MSKYDSDDFSDFFNSDSSDNTYNSQRINKDSDIPAKGNGYEDPVNLTQDNDYNGFYDREDDFDDEEEDFDSGYHSSGYSRQNNSEGRNESYDNNPKKRNYSEFYDNDDYDNSNDSSHRRNVKKNKTDSEEINMRKKLRKSKRAGVFLSIIQLIVSIGFMILLFFARNSLSSIITIPVYISIGVILGILFLVTFIMQSKRLLIKRIGKTISAIIIILLLVLSYFLYPLTGTTIGGTKKVTMKPFVIYLSGDDAFGEISDKSNGRSDTNILAVINPETHTALLLSTPRDAYVELVGEEIPEGNFDKLTHAGKYGAGVKDENGNWKHGFDVSMDTLGNLYDIKIENYLRLNFTGFSDLVDELGGITLDIPEGFSTYTYGKSYTFEEGVQQLTGDEALTYVRERHSFATGDLQRGANQVAVIQAIVDKAISANTITNFSGIVKSISKSLETNMDLSSLAALQLQIQGSKDYDGWNMVSYTVDGSTGGGYQYCYTTDSYLSVVLLDDDSVDVATKMIDMVINGEEVTDKTAKQIENGTLDTDSE